MVDLLRATLDAQTAKERPGGPLAMGLAARADVVSDVVPDETFLESQVNSIIY